MDTNYTRKRLKEIVSVSVKHGLKGGINNPKQFRMTLEELGPTFIKFGQILSTRSDILPSEYISELKGLQDDVKSETFEIIREVIENELDKPLEESFSLFEEKPIASASLSQVHYAELDTGEKVVVKVQRPKTKEKMMADIDILRRLAPFINLTPTGSAMDAKEVIEELANATIKELDFINEAENTEDFGEKNKDVKFILCPKVYKDYCTEKIIVIDYIKGIKIDNIEKLKAEGYDLKDISTKLTYNYFKQVFEDGFFHADPHPGNIFIYDRKIGYIDFGLMGNLNDGLRKKFNGFLEGVANRDINLMTKSVLKIGEKKGPVDIKDLYEDIEIIYEQYIEESMEDLDLPQIIEEVFKVCKDNNIYMPKDITLLVKGLMTIQGLIAKLDSEINIMDTALPYVKNHMANEKLKNIDFTESLYSIYKMVRSNLIISSKIVELIDQITNGNLKAQIDFKKSEEAANELNKMVNRLIFGMIIAGLVVSSSIVINANVGFKIYGISALGLIGYLGAGIVGFWLLISIIRSGKL